MEMPQVEATFEQTF